MSRPKAKTSRVKTKRHRARRARRPGARRQPTDGELDRLLAEALKLPPELRAVLANSLIDSLEPDFTLDDEAALAIEIARRVRDSKAGRTKSIPWEKARRIIRGE